MKDIITIDGPSGAGKSTVSRLLANRLGYRYLDTGALYRAVAWKVKKERINPDDEKRLDKLLDQINITLEKDKIIVNGTDVTSLLRDPEIGELSSQVSARPEVRKHLFTVQRQTGLQGKVVVEGRDIGSAILPEAENKFFLDASLKERSARRHKELKKKGAVITFKNVQSDIEKRDERDSTRQSSPLKRTEDMIYIDTSDLTVEEVVAKILKLLKTS